MTRSRAVLTGTLAAFLLVPTAVAAAGPPTSLRTTSAPPSATAAGEAFTLTGRVRNVSKRAVRTRVTVTLRTKRAAKDGRIVAVKYLPTLAPKRSRGYRVKVRVARSVAPGRYFVVTCARAGNKRASCAVAKRRLTSSPRGRPRAGAARRAAGGAAGRAAAAPDDAAPGPVVEDGVTQPVYGYADAIRQRVWVPIEFDTDGDGTNDRISVDIIRPKATSEGLKVPIIMDASPYYDTVCRGNEGECKSDVDGDGLNDRWPLFYDNYFVPRGYAVALLDTVGTNNSTGCPTVGGRPDILGITRVIDWLTDAPPATTSSGAAPRWPRTGAPATSACGASRSTRTRPARRPRGRGAPHDRPISGISSWYKYYRIGGLRFSSGGPSGLANTITLPARREQCAPLRQQIATNAGEGTVPPRPRAIQRVLGRARRPDGDRCRRRSSSCTGSTTTTSSPTTTTSGGTTSPPTTSRARSG